MVPVMYNASASRKRRRHNLQGLQLMSRSSVYSLDSFKTSYIGSIHSIWAKLPQELVNDGRVRGWRSITRRCKKHLLKSGGMANQKTSKQKLLVDRLDIEFETRVKDYDWSLGIKV